MKAQDKDWIAEGSISKKMIDKVLVRVHYDVAAPEVTDEEARVYIQRGRVRDPVKTLSSVKVEIGQERVRLEYFYQEKNSETIKRRV